MGRHASRDPVPISKIAYIDEPTLNQIVEEIELPAASWGNIGGTLSNQTDLNSALAGKSATGHTHSYEPANANIQTHISTPHAPANAQSNNISDVNAGLLTGGQETNLHSHTGGGGGLTQAQILTRQL